MSDKKPKDPFEEAHQQPLDLPVRYVSRDTVDVGEGLRFLVTKFEVIADRFDEERQKKVGQIVGEVLESRAHRFADGQEIEIRCGSLALEKLANEAPQIDDDITLVRGEDEGKTVGWRYKIERASDEGSATP